MKIIVHNLHVLPRKERGWYMSGDETSDDLRVFTFRHAGKDQHTVRTNIDGWTEEDADSFHRWLMGWDYVSYTNVYFADQCASAS